MAPHPGPSQRARIPAAYGCTTLPAHRWQGPGLVVVVVVVVLSSVGVGSTGDGPSVWFAVRAPAVCRPPPGASPPLHS